MTHDAIAETLDHAQRLWPGRITDAHREAAFQAWERYPLQAEQARAALNAIAVEFKGYVTVAHVTERLRRIAYPDDRQDGVKQARREAQRIEDAQYAAERARHDAVTLRWLDSIDQSDIDATVAYARRVNPPFAVAFLDGGPVTLDRLRETYGLRHALHAAARASAGETP